LLLNTAGGHQSVCRADTSIATKEANGHVNPSKPTIQPGEYLFEARTAAAEQIPPEKQEAYRAATRERPADLLSSTDPRLELTKDQFLVLQAAARGETTDELARIAGVSATRARRWFMNSTFREAIKMEKARPTTRSFRRLALEVGVVEANARRLETLIGRIERTEVESMVLPEAEHSPVRDPTEPLDVHLTDRLDVLHESLDEKDPIVTMQFLRPFIPLIVESLLSQLVRPRPEQRETPQEGAPIDIPSVLRLPPAANDGYSSSS
jgi:hypothetical protein